MWGNYPKNGEIFWMILDKWLTQPSIRRYSLYIFHHKLTSRHWNDGTWIEVITKKNGILIQVNEVLSFINGSRFNLNRHLNGSAYHSYQVKWYSKWHLNYRTKVGFYFHPLNNCSVRMADISKLMGWVSTPIASWDLRTLTHPQEFFPYPLLPGPFEPSEPPVRWGFPLSPGWFRTVENGGEWWVTHLKIPWLIIVSFFGINDP